MRSLRQSLVTRLTRLGVAVAVGVTLVATAPAGTARADGGEATNTQITTAVNYWNDVVLEAARRKGGGPGPIARMFAILNAGMFDAANSVIYSQANSIRFQKYLQLTQVSPSVNADLAVGYAARDLLIFAEPAQRTFFEQKFTQRYGTQSQGAAYNLAQSVVTAMSTARSNDGAASTFSYTPDGVLGAWRPTPVNGVNCTPVDNHWGNVKPFTMTSGDQFKRELPYSSYSEMLSHPTYRSQLEEVRRLGRYNSTYRTTDQTQIAWFWANDLDGTYKPPGQYLATAKDVANLYLSDGLQISRLLALVSLAMADGGIAAWQMKYLNGIDLWRPQSAVQLDPISPDNSWLPLSADRNDNRLSPCFPAHVSGHATMGAAWAGVLRGVLGDTRTFTVRTEDPHAVGVTRTYNSFTAAANENARSRVYLGVHFQWDADNGQAAGYDIALQTYSNYLTAVAG